MKLIDQCKTFADFRDLIAVRQEWIDYKDAYEWFSKHPNGEKILNSFNERAAEMYAKFKIKEAKKNARNKI